MSSPVIPSHFPVGAAPTRSYWEPLVAIVGVSIAVLLIVYGWLLAIGIVLVILFASISYPKTTLYVLVFLLPFAPYVDPKFVVREMGTIVRILASLASFLAISFVGNA